MAQQAEPELADLVGMVRELLLWEEELSGTGIPSANLRPNEPQKQPAARPMPDEASAPLQPPNQRQPPPEAPSGTPPRPEQLRILAEKAASCTACRLHEGRTKSVFDRGSPRARIAFVGEGPGYHEDQEGSPFVGKAGQLLDKMIQAMELSEDDFYICNVVKCRPPENRTPRADEALACMGWLKEQLAVVRPEVIVALGKCATEHLGCLNPEVRRWRGLWGNWEGVPVMPTYHPAFLLRSPQFKRPAWEDLQAVMKRLANPGGEGH